MTDTILIVDDEPDLLLGLERTLAAEIDCRILLAQNGADAIEKIKNNAVDLVLTDINMPGMNGLTLLNEIKVMDPAITVVIMTAYGTIERAVEAIKGDAYDFLQKPFEDAHLFHLLKKGLERNRLVRENARLMERVRENAPLSDMVGKSPPMIKVFNTIQMLAQTDVTVLILGETGTGKDLAARAIHRLSKRKEGPMVTVNCPALPENLLESELFGHLKGAFTNADNNKAGLFEQADCGTIFLDEIGDLSNAVQTKLLRVLQEKEIRPLGSNVSRKVDVRIISATNQDLQKKMREGRFREDLFFRLNVGRLAMPSLDETREDIPLLAEHFLIEFAREQDMAPKHMSPELLNYLLERKWPGNVRELENTIRNWCVMSPGETLGPALLPEGVKPLASICGSDEISRPYKDLKEKAIQKFTLSYINRLLEHTGGNITLSAQISGIKRQSLQKIIKRYKVPIERFRQ